MPFSRFSFPRRLIVASLLLLLLIGSMFAAPLLTSADPVQIAVSKRLAGPSWAHPFGQDEFGRDRLARVLYGGQVSLTVAFLASFIAMAIGTFIGLMGAYFRGLFEFIAMRVSDVVLFFPPILLALLVVTIFGPGVSTMVAVLALLYFPSFSRIAYSETLRVSALDFVEAARALGTKPRRIVVSTVLPNILGAISVQFSLTAAAAITVESGLSFLGLGVVPPAPSWGQMIRGARGFMEQDPLGIFVPCAALCVTIYAINLFCDRLRDVLDPKGMEDGKDSVSPAGRQTAAPAKLDTDSAAELRGLTLSLNRGKREAPAELVRDITLKLRRNQCTALVGESGSGKSLTSLALMGLLPSSIRPSAGHIAIERKSGAAVDLVSLAAKEAEKVRGDDIAMIFQEPMTSLNPVLRVGVQMVEALQAHRKVTPEEARNRCVAALDRVGIPEAEQRFDSYPHELSGGMRQRVMIAMALLCEPKLLIADEPTTALDVTIQAEIIDLLRDLRANQDSGLSMLFISHNLGIVADIADRVVVMYSGEIVEEGPAGDILSDPHHPYTRALLESMPSLHEEMHSSRGDRLGAIGGTPPLPQARPSGCAFRDRCPDAKDACAATHPGLYPSQDALRAVRCIFAPEASSFLKEACDEPCVA
ncbi:dipeptide/oligopeptide/nickel ABC transporter permease/ATP-binding protein [Labrenzia sp. OB1]|uniref:dipeptide/oligopeptide/nickel ABC transporter permease/ATP-binding protein n=1 Tax=Labrenzia sp. OB1 TaxID=1561204 RepID=UPI0007B1D6F2|nr:dipeptide/oligopeptide/nickel ABC transporter permease/ATP-binding protein [Labrenzia sp. OB1]KZM48226.1 peptide ABC transporter permease [Labrenzia sp. OB1]